MSLQDSFYSVFCSNVNNSFCRTGHISKCCVKEAENSFFWQFSDSGCWGSVTRGEECQEVPPVLLTSACWTLHHPRLKLTCSIIYQALGLSVNVCGKFGGQAHILVPPKWLMFMRRFGVGGYSQGGRGKWQSHINKCFRPFWNSPWQSACHNEIYDWAVAAGIETEINNSIFAMQTICRNIVEVWATPFVSLASKRRAKSKGERAREEERWQGCLLWTSSPSTSASLTSPCSSLLVQ